MAATLVVALFAVSFAGYISGTHWVSPPQLHPATNTDPKSAALIAFRKSLDPAVRTQSVRTLKEQYLLSTSTRSRALIINALIGMAHAAHEPYIFDAIFDGPPFHSMLTNDSMQSLDNLANYSLTLYPTAYAEQMSAFAAGQDLGDLIFDQKVPRTDPRIKEKADLVLSRVEKAKQYVGNDLLDAESPEDSAEILTSFMQWEGHLLGDISTVYPQYKSPALNYISKAISVAESFRDENGAVLPQLQDKITTLNWGYARYGLSGNDPKTRPGDVEAHIHTLIQILREHPEDNTNFYLALRQAQKLQAQTSSGMNMNMQDTSSSTAMSKELHERLIRAFLNNLKKMSDFSPEAKQFLEEQGFHFS